MNLIKVIRKKFQIAATVPFEADGTNFPTSIKECQSAIEYAKQNAEGFPRAGLPLVYNGTLGNGDWISYSNLTPDTPIVFPVRSKIKEVTWANDPSRDNRDFDLEFYRNGEAAGDLYWTYQVRSSAEHYGFVDGRNDIFEAGDFMRIKYIDQGLNCADLVVVIWFSRIPEEP